MMEREGCIRVYDHGSSKFFTAATTEPVNVGKSHGSGKEGNVVSVPTIFGLQLVCQADRGLRGSIIVWLDLV